MNVGKFLTGWFMVILILVLGSAGAFLNKDTILALASTIQARFNPPTLATGLVGFWSFNGPDVTDKVYDRSGNSNNGFFLGGATSSVKTLGKTGQALTFDGVDDYLQIPDHPTLGGMSALTISGWLYIPNDIADDSMIFCKRHTAAPYNSYNMRISTTNGRLEPTIVNAAESNSDFTATDNGSVVYNAWSHFTIVYNGTNVTMYQNGVRSGVASGALTGAVYDSADALYLGSCTGSVDYTKIKIDDFRIHSRALSGEEIKQLYNQGVGSKIQASQSDTMTNGLVGYWSFDGADVTDKIYDRSSQGSHAFFLGGATSSALTQGKMGQALRFDGSNDGVVSTSNNSGIASLTQATIAFWVNPTQFSGATGGLFVSHTGDGGGNGPYTQGFGVSRDMYYNTQRIRLTVDGTGGDMNAAAGTDLPLNTWTHVTVVWDGSLTATNVKFYHNGVLVPVGASGDGSGSYVQSDGNFAIGSMVNEYNPLLGSLDEVRVYNRQLSPEEVKQLYNKGAGSVANASQSDQMTNGLVGLWSFDGADVTDKVYDRSGNGNNGYFVGGATSSARAIGKVGQALTFDGTDDRVSTTDIAAIDTATTLSSCAWVKNNTNTTDDTIVQKYAAGDDGWSFQRDDVGAGSGRTDMYALYLADSADADNVRLEGATGSSITNAWNHVCFTFLAGSATGARLYLNGSEDPNSPVSTVTIGAINGGTSPVEIGATGSGSSPHDGLLDDVRIYTRVLTPDEIIHLYNKGR